MKREDVKVGQILAMPRGDTGIMDFFRVVEIRANGPMMQPLSKQEAEAEIVKAQEEARISGLPKMHPKTLIQ